MALDNSQLASRPRTLSLRHPSSPSILPEATPCLPSRPQPSPAVPSSAPWVLLPLAVRVRWPDASPLSRPDGVSSHRRGEAATRPRER